MPHQETVLTFCRNQFAGPNGFLAVVTAALLAFCAVLTVAAGTFLIKPWADLTALIGIPQDPSTPHITTNVLNIFRFFIRASFKIRALASRKRFGCGADLLIHSRAFVGFPV